MTAKRLFNIFHETFPLSVPSVKAILDLSAEWKGSLTAEDIREKTHLGTNYVKAMPRYARGCGLLQMEGYSLTPFGYVAFTKDPNLAHPATLWLMHYHLSAPQGPGPEFWNYVVTHQFRIGEEINATRLGDHLTQYLVKPSGEALSNRAIRSSASAILGTYSKSDGFGRLGILKENKVGRLRSYEVLEPEPPSAGVLAYALADYWGGNFGDRASVNLGEITSAGGFISLFFMGSGLLSNRLGELQRKGLLQVHRVAPPHQVVKLWATKESLLEQIYDD